MLNVLLSSASAKVPMLKAVQNAVSRLSMTSTVIAGDSDPSAISQYFADAFWEMPKTEDKAFDDILNQLKERSISHVIPSRDGELAFWAHHKSALLENGIQVIVANQDAVDICLDKLLFAQSADFPAIPTTDDIAGITAERMVVKERFGAGSHKILLNASRNEANAYAATLTAPVFQPFMEGKEISVDAWLDKNAKVKGHIYRYREVIRRGESQVTSTVSLDQFDATIVPLLERLRLTGPVVLQAIIDRNGDIHVVECNSRFGGASTLGIKAGVDSFYWSLLESLGEDITSVPFIPAAIPVRQIRFAQDLYQ